VELVKLSATPPSIVYPLPVLAFLLFSLSGNRDIFGLLVAIAFNFTSQAGINLWNHLNDVEEDRLAGKVNVLIEHPETRVVAIILSFLLYALSFFILYLFSRDRKFALAAFFVVSILTLAYSDRSALGKRRLKNYYLTEVFTYVVSVPLYTLTVWTIYSSINSRAFAVALFMTPFALSGTFLKDIKDASSDEKAGLRTLAVVFSPSALLKVSVALLWCYYFLLALFSILGVIPERSMIALAFSVALLYSNYRYAKEDWIVSGKLLKPLKIMVLSNLLSLVFLAAVNLAPLP